LFVRAIALENGSGRVVIALVDAIGVGRDMADEAKAVAARKTGWKLQEMLVSGTHTHALHYVGGIPKVTEDDGRVVGMASADYFGEFARIMPYRIGGSNPPDDCVAMMTNAASGDINNIDFYRRRPPRAPFEQIRVVAGKAADAAWRAVKKIDHYNEDPLIAVRQREVVLRYRIPSAAEIDNANRLLALPRQEREAINRRTTQYPLCLSSHVQERE